MTALATRSSRNDMFTESQMTSAFSNNGPRARLLDRLESARYLSIRERHLSAITAEGELPCIKIGRAVRYSIDDLDGYVASRRTNTNGG